MCIFSITGESGSGKSEIVRKVLAATERAYMLTSVTTRLARPSDLSGEYQHVSKEAFLQMKAQGEFLWDVEHGDKHYGTRHEDVADAIQDKRRIGVMILVPSVLPLLHQHLTTLGASYRDWLACYIKPMGNDILRARMRSRGDDPRSIDRRLEAEHTWPLEMLRFNNHVKAVHMVGNTGPLPYAVQEILSLLGTEICC